MVPSGAKNGDSGRGLKKPGTPNVIAEAVLRLFIIGRIDSNPTGSAGGEYFETRSQKSLKRWTRSCAELPVISAALIAPIETPATQSGSIPASCSAAYAPA